MTGADLNMGGKELNNLNKILGNLTCETATSRASIRTRIDGIVGGALGVLKPNQFELPHKKNFFFCDYLERRETSVSQTIPTRSTNGRERHLAPTRRG